jgi:hypothetical protein
MIYSGVPGDCFPQPAGTTAWIEQKEQLVVEDEFATFTVTTDE